MGLFTRLFGARNHAVSQPIRRTLADPADDERPWWDRDEPEPKSEDPNAPVIERVVTNRVFLLGLDELYRSAMAEHELEELLPSAQCVASALSVLPADVPVEGYYAEDEDLTAYFQLMRALQDVPLARSSEVDKLPEFGRLLEVTSSPIYGPAVREGLLPTGKDPVSAALELLASQEAEWTVPALTDTASSIAVEKDDYSLVGLAARAKDPVVLAALRESVVLYAMCFEKSFLAVRPPVYRYVWRVDPELARAASRFVEAFNDLFGKELPLPIERYARVFWNSSQEAKIVGRCVRIGQTPPPEQRYYHWAIVEATDGQLGVREFWDSEIWTTERYRGSTGPGNDPSTSARIEGLGLHDR